MSEQFKMNFTDSEVSFLVYLGWKTLGWALVFLGVILVLRFIKVWLLHAWVREVTRQETDREQSRAEAIQEICCRMETNRRTRRLLIIRPNGRIVSAGIGPAGDDDGLEGEAAAMVARDDRYIACLLYTSPSPRD